MSIAVFLCVAKFADALRTTATVLQHEGVKALGHRVTARMGLERAIRAANRDTTERKVMVLNIGCNDPPSGREWYGMLESGYSRWQWPSVGSVVRGTVM